MTTSQTKSSAPLAIEVTLTDEALGVELADGRTLSVPLSWFPRLWHATPAERGHWRLIGQGQGIQWPTLDEDISIAGLLSGQPSHESQRSLQRWLAKRTTSLHG
jgi:hypothetical protein